MNISTKNKNGVSGTPGETALICKKECIADYLGVMPYEQALKLQEALAQARAEGRIPDVLLLLQHPPVFTIGRFMGEEDIIVPAETLTRESIAVVHTNRGGGVTYHGPGQLVAYPILNIRESHLGVREYICKLEEVVIRLLLSLGIQGYRTAKCPGGVWVDGCKICSIGIYISRGITMHGLAINTSTNLRHFAYINPCGLRGDMMTSISKLLGKLMEPEDIIDDFLASFSQTFGLRNERGLAKWLCI